MKLPLLLAIAALGLCGCASTPKSEPTVNDDGVDRGKDGHHRRTGGALGRPGVLDEPAAQALDSVRRLTP